MLGLLVDCVLAGSLLLQSAAPPPPQPQRDVRPPRPTSGMAEISGRVITADTGLPVRRAVVQLGGAPLVRSAHTDAYGRFAFTGLPAGSYTVTAQAGPGRAGYLSAGYGVALLDQRGPGPVPRPKAIELSDGQQLKDIEIRLPRAAAISGRVVDAAGEPIARIGVSAVSIRRGMPPQNTARATTDDLGQFRLFGLAPGDYVISAEPPGGMFSVPGEIEGEPTGFALTYAPGTASLDQAQRVRLARGGHAALDIQLTEARLFSISGTVLNSAGEPPRDANVMIMRADQMASGSSFGTSVSATGAFTIRSVPPGVYDVVVRTMISFSSDQAAGGMRMQVQEQAIVRVEVANAAVEGVSLVTSRGQTVSGEIVFDDAVTEGRRASLQVVQVQRVPMVSTPVVEVKGTAFTVRQVFGPILLRGSASGAGPEGLVLKAVLLNGKDITDQPTVLTSAHSGHLQVLFTSRPAMLEGSVTDDKGQPVEDYVVLLYGEESDSWVPYSTSFRNGRSLKGGKYNLRGLKEGKYRIVALPSDVLFQTSAPDVELLEMLKNLATPVLVNAGETRTVDLRLVRIADQ